MGTERTMSGTRLGFSRPLRLRRGRPRSFTEWSTLRRWGKLPPWELDVPGYVLRAARVAARLTQRQLADRLGITQQAVSRQERWTSNPTLGLMRSWLEACGNRLELKVVADWDGGGHGDRDQDPQPGQ